MNLSEALIGTSYTVKSVNANSQLKNRFHSFGIVKDAIIKIEAVTLAKETIEIKINKSKIALRFSEAKNIEITDAK
jgi:ferrous iron transport protein A